MSYAKLKDPVGNCKVLEYPSTGVVTAGTFSVVNDLLVYNLSGATASGQMVKGVFGSHSNGIEAPKQSGLAINVGDEVWWDTGANEIDKTNTNVNAGYCIRAAVAGDATVRFSLSNPNVG